MPKSKEELARTHALSIVEFIDAGDWEGVIANAERLLGVVQPLAADKRDKMDPKKARRIPYRRPALFTEDPRSQFTKPAGGKNADES